MTCSGVNRPVLRSTSQEVRPSPAVDHLFAQELAREDTQPHDVGHRAGGPPFGEHADRDDVLDVLAGLARPADRIDLPPQQLGPLLSHQLPGRSVVASARTVHRRAVGPAPAAPPDASASPNTFESMCGVRSGSRSASIRTFPLSNACLMRAAVSVRFVL